MKMTELLTAIGDDGIQFQNLDQCATDLRYTAAKGTFVTFGTEQPLLPDGTKRLGLVIWLDRDAVAKTIAK